MVMTKDAGSVEEWVKQEWTVGQYTPTASFKTITNHSCVCKKSDMGLVAITGPAEDEESQKMSDLFSAAPDMLKACQHALPLLKHLNKFLKYQRQGREFWPNREDGDATLETLAAAIAKALGEKTGE